MIDRIYVLMTPIAQLSLLASTHLALALWSVYHILLYKRDPRSAMGWLIVCLFVPLMGPMAYFLFGINRVRSRAANIKRTFLTVDYEASANRPAPSSGTFETGLRGVGQRITGLPLSAGNRVTTLHHGGNAYPAMLASIQQAQTRVLFASFIFKMDTIGQRFVEALADAVARGVEVMVLVDGIGEWYSWPRASRLLRKRGINVARFLPPRLIPPSIYLNLRNHRKLLVVDADVAYAGGMNISDELLETADRPLKVSDIHFALRGPIVDSLATVFCRDWHFTTGQAVTDQAAAGFEHGAHEPGAHCRAIPDGPDGEMDAIALTIQAVISAAARSVEIMTPYFLPGRELITSLQAAALRGTTVRIVLPAKNNLFYVHWANSNLLAELLPLGIQVYYQPAPFCHSKLLLIDDSYSLIGSANLDPRSLRLNFELGIEVFSPALNQELRAHFASVVSASRRLSHESLRNRPVPVRLRDSLASLMSPYL